jgi:pyroglutamyl-peptidase
MARILVTGFGPFPGAPVNPTMQLVAGLARMRRTGISDGALATHVFETSYAAVDRELPMLLNRHKPKVLIMFGLAARTKFLRIEMVARNRKSALHPDRTGAVARGLTIAAGAPPSRKGRASFGRLVAAAHAGGVHSRLSRDAGRYICNYLYWRALEAAQQPSGPEIAVFVHVPKLRSRTRRRGKNRVPTANQLLRAVSAIVLSASHVHLSR